MDSFSAKDPSNNSISDSENLKSIDLEEALAQTSDHFERRFLIGAISSSFSGPLPHPEILKAYMELDPNSLDWFKSQAERKLTISEKFAESEMEMMKEDARDRKWGQVLAFSIIVLFLISGLIAILNDYVVSGSIIASLGPIVTQLARIFIQGRENDKESSTSPNQSPS